MIPAIALPPLQIAAPPALAVPTPASEAAIGLLPFSSVAAPVALPELYNNRQGQAQGRGGMARPHAASDFLPSLESEPAPGVKLTASGASSSFLAQLFSQTSDAETAGLVSFFTSPPPFSILDYRTFMEFSQVRYKPSNAGVPQPKPVAPITIGIEQAHQEMPVAEQSATVSSPAPAASSEKNLPAPEQRTEAPHQESPPLPRTYSERSVSLIGARGFDAYVAAFVRAAANLNQRPATASDAA